MKFTSAALLLPALALAAPIEQDIEARANSGPITLEAIGHTASPIGYRQINASGRAFYIGKTTTTSCPAGVQNLDCTKLNKSVTSLFTSDTAAGTIAGLNTVVPGGQNLYVQADGALGFTEAHSVSVPAGAYTTGFVYTSPAVTDTSYGQLSFNAGGATGFFACPTAASADVYQVFANVKGFKNNANCISFDVHTSSWTGAAAWQYE